jgi:hypothetical protein
MQLAKVILQNPTSCLQEIIPLAVLLLAEINAAENLDFQQQI